MKNLYKLLGIAVLAMAVVFSFAACNNSTSNGGGGGGTTVPKTVEGETTVPSNGFVYFKLDYGAGAGAGACTVTITTNLPSPNNTFILTTPLGEDSDKVIGGLSEGQKVTFTATVNTGGLEVDTSSLGYVDLSFYRSGKKY
jgi:hypothetical protein